MITTDHIYTNSVIVTIPEGERYNFDDESQPYFQSDEKALTYSTGTKTITDIGTHKYIVESTSEVVEFVVIPGEGYTIISQTEEIKDTIKTITTVYDDEIGNRHQIQYDMAYTAPATTATISLEERIANLEAMVKALDGV